MSKVKKVIDQTIKNVQISATNAFGAKLYTYEQVLDMLNYLQSECTGEDGETAGVGITTDMISDLVERIEARIDSNIDNMSDSDIIDQDSLEASISGGRISIDSLDVDKDQITSEATYGIDDTIGEWAYDNKILLDN